MGWGGGTEIFDTVADELTCGKYEEGGDLWAIDIEPEITYQILSSLYIELSRQDWDNEYESRYWDHPVIGRILGNTFEYDE